MPALLVKCERCGLRRFISVSQAEATFWWEGLSFDRFCDTCGDMTRWVRAGPFQAGEPIRLLLIDDDAPTLTLLQKVLSEANFVVAQADSSRGALLKLVNESFDLIISDIRMPGMDGKKLYRFLENYIPEYRHRMIFLTGDYSEETREFLKKTGCPYSFKPINWGELMRQIGDLLPKVGLIPKI